MPEKILDEQGLVRRINDNPAVQDLGDKVINDLRDSLVPDLSNDRGLKCQATGLVQMQADF